MSIFQGVGSKVAGFLFEQEESSDPKTPTVTNPIPSTNSDIVKDVTEQVDPSILNILNNIVSARKSSYTSLLEISERMLKAIPDETTRINAAYSVISREGRSADNVVQSIDLHLSDLSSEFNSFMNTSENTKRENLSALQTKLSQTESSIQTNNKTIDELAARIGELKRMNDEASNNVVQINSEIENAKSAVDKVVDKYKTTYEYVVNDLKSKKVFISSILLK